MKATITICGLALMVSYSQAQSIPASDVPQNVLSSFAEKFPNAKVEKWQKEKNDYEAEFKRAGIEFSAVISADGKFMEMEQEIKTSELPPAIRQSCDKNFAGYKLHEASRITDAGGKVTYEAEMKEGKNHFDAIFDFEGNLLSRQSASSKDEDKD